MKYPDPFGIKLELPIKIGEKCEKCKNRFNCFTGNDNYLTPDSYNIYTVPNISRSNIDVTFSIEGSSPMVMCLNLGRLRYNGHFGQARVLCHSDKIDIDKSTVENDGKRIIINLKGDFFPKV